MGDSPTGWEFLSPVELIVCRIRARSVMSMLMSGLMKIVDFVAATGARAMVVMRGACRAAVAYGPALSKCGWRNFSSCRPVCWAICTLCEMMVVGGVSGKNSVLRGLRALGEASSLRSNSAFTPFCSLRPIAYEVVGARFWLPGGGDGMIGREECVLWAFFRLLGRVPEPILLVD